MLEAALELDEALEAADRAALFKTFAKVLAQRRGLMATFMAKWSQRLAGPVRPPAHLARARTAKRVPRRSRARTTCRETMRWFVGGQQALMPELLAMVARTVNSYTRLVPGFWAPTNATWGVENRTTALRVIRGGPRSQRVEYRIAAADINPYIALAAALGSGLWGIEHRIEPDRADRAATPTTTKHPAELGACPRRSGTRPQRLKTLARPRASSFGDAFVDHYAATRQWEEREFRKADHRLGARSATSRSSERA